MVPRERLFSKESIFDVVVGLPATCLVQVIGELARRVACSRRPTYFSIPLYALTSDYIAHDFLC